MTTLYKPALIETVEQAEALPIGTVTLPPARHSRSAVATVKCDDGFWRETGNEQPFTDPEMLDEIALVPIEAEEETTGALVNRAGDIHWEESRRLATPWKAA